MIETKECKYRLPCNWCDKFNKFCDMTEPIKIELPDANNCDHDWKAESTSMFPSDNGEPYYVTKYVCRKCYTTELIKTDVHGNRID